MNNLYNKDLILKRLEFAKLSEYIRINSLYKVGGNLEFGKIYKEEANLYKSIKSYVFNHYDDIEKRVLNSNFDDENISYYLEAFDEDPDIDNVNTIKMIAVFPSLVDSVPSLEDRSYEEIKYLTLLAVFLKEEHYSIKQFFENEYILSFINDNSFDPDMKIKLLNYFASFATNTNLNINDDNFTFILGGALTDPNFELVNDENSEYYNNINAEVISDYQKEKKILKISQICPLCNENWYMDITNRNSDLGSFFDHYKKYLGDTPFKKDIKMINDEIDILIIRNEKLITDKHKYNCPKCVKKLIDKEKIGKSKVLNFKR